MSESGKISIIAKNIKGNAKGKVRYDANKISNTSGGVFSQNATEKGLSHNNNTARKEAVGIKIVKLEGPFDNDGKVVKQVKPGQVYKFKATPSRAPLSVEIPALKWIMKIDDHEQVLIKNTENHNSLTDKKITINLRMPTTFEKVKVYAFYRKPDDGVSVEIKNNNVFHPYIIAKSRHRKGMNEAGTGTHHDMMSKDMTDEEIIALNPDTKKWIDIVNKEGYKGIQKLAIEMEDLLTDFSQGELEDVNLKLYRKFVGNKEGDFSDEILTKAAKEHKSTKLFFERIKKNMQAQLKIDNDFVFERQLLINREIIDPKMTIQRKDTPSPTYSDKYGGLGIAINDTWGYDMKILSFEQNTQKRTFSAEFEVEIFDHYGLNSEDIDPKIKGGWFGPANFEGFLCWFILQHKCGYKPFLTIMKIKNKIINETY